MKEEFFIKTVLATFGLFLATIIASTVFVGVFKFFQSKKEKRDGIKMVIISNAVMGQVVLLLCTLGALFFDNSLIDIAIIYIICSPITAFYIYYYTCNRSQLEVSTKNNSTIIAKSWEIKSQTDGKRSV